jgi:hypothetical protein
VHYVISSSTEPLLVLQKSSLSLSQLVKRALTLMEQSAAAEVSAELSGFPVQQLLLTKINTIATYIADR